MYSIFKVNNRAKLKLIYNLVQWLLSIYHGRQRLFERGM